MLDYIVIGVVLMSMLFIINHARRKKRAGKGFGCGCGCENCSQNNCDTQKNYQDKRINLVISDSN